MADKNLNSITFPGLPDKYKVAQVADEYSASSTYAVGDIVNYLGTTYRCTTAITTAENWTAGHWTPVKIAKEVADLKSALNYSKQLIDVSDYNEINGVIQSTGDWGGYSSEAYKSVLITDIPRKIVFICLSETSCQLSFFSAVPSQPTGQYSNIFFCQGETGRHSVDVGNSQTFIVPDDCKCIVVTTKSNWTNKHFELYALNIKDYFVTPQMFGAKGDGVTDDTVAFQALNRRTAFIPEGTYIVSGVEYGRKTTIFGAGMGKSIIKQKAGETGDLIKFVNADSSSLTNVTLQGQTGETSNNDYRALLKIMTQTGSVSFSNYSNFEHIALLDAPGSGMVLLGIESTDSDNPNTKNNWVHHINDVRIERCNLWCMIDETSDNLFSNLYLSEGNKGCLLCRRASSNMYSNLKLDQPYYAGSGGSLSGYVDGALIVIRYCGNIRFTNIDLQSAYYVGAKIFGSNRIHFDGDINNCGIGANGEGIGLAIKESQNCTFNIAFGYVSANYRQKYNAKIDTGCSNVSVYANEHYVTENLNACPDSCFIENPSRISSLYNSQSIDKLITLNTNLFSNPLCDSLDGWRGTTGFSIDSNGKTVGTNSFKVVGDSSESYGIYQTFNNVVAGDHYLILCMVNIEQKSTIYADSSAQTAYVISNSGGIDSYSYSKYSKAPNTVGKHLLMEVGVAQNDKIEPQFRVYKNNGIYFFGNFMLLNLNEVGLSFPMSENMYDAIYSQLKTFMNDPFSGVSVSVPMDYSQVMNILRTLIQS